MAAASNYLRSLQGGAFGSVAGAAYDHRVLEGYLASLPRWDAARRQLLEDNLKRRAAYEARYQALLPTPFQSVQDYARLIEAKRAIDGELERVGQYEPRHNLVLGSAERASLNALSGYFRSSDEYLVVFNRGLLLAVLATANFAACSLSFDTARAADRIDDRIVAQLAPRYGQLLATVSQGDAPPPEVTIPLFHLLDKEVRWTKLEDAAFEFVLAHEYAHILRGHLLPSRQGVGEDCGGWGAEYEADSLALDLVAQAWLARNGGNPAALAFLLQGVGLFFALICHIERYGAQVRGDPNQVWTVAKSHPPTPVRWQRLIDKVRGAVNDGVWTLVRGQTQAIERCLDELYALGAGGEVKGTEAAVEWAFQRSAWDTMAGHRLVPQHLFIALRCTRAALDGGTPVENGRFDAMAARADADLLAAGARPLRSYRAPLPAIAREMSARALGMAKLLGGAATGQIVNRLMDAVLLDARTRYELPPR